MTTSTLTPSDLDCFKATRPLSPLLMPNIRTFYSPQDEVHGALKAVLSSATVSVVVQMYGYDDDELAGIIDGQLKDPRIHVQITLDRSQAGGVHEKAILAKYAHEMTGNSVAIGTSEHNAIVHRKMAIIDGTWRISGSTNWSTSGESLQDNELTIIYAPAECAEARAILDIEHDHALQQMAARAKAAA